MASTAQAKEGEVIEERLRPIIVKKIIVSGGDGHHGGAGRVATAITVAPGRSPMPIS